MATAGPDSLFLLVGGINRASTGSLASESGCDVPTRRSSTSALSTGSSSFE